MLEPGPQRARNFPPSGASSMVSGSWLCPAPPSGSWVGAAAALSLDKGLLHPQPANRLPTATTASRFYRIDRAQVSTSVLLPPQLVLGHRVTLLGARPSAAGSPHPHRLQCVHTGPCARPGHGPALQAGCTGIMLAGGGSRRSQERLAGWAGEREVQLPPRETQKERHFWPGPGHWGEGLLAGGRGWQAAGPRTQRSGAGLGWWARRGGSAEAGGGGTGRPPWLPAHSRRFSGPAGLAAPSPPPAGPDPQP